MSPKNDPLTTQETPKTDPELLEEHAREFELLEERMLEHFWYGTIDGEAFDGDPSDLW